jgi:hypothetical protein
MAMEKKRTLWGRIDDIMRARQFIDGNISAKTLAWSKNPEKQKIIERQRKMIKRNKERVK